MAKRDKYIVAKGKGGSVSGNRRAISLTQIFCFAETSFMLEPVCEMAPMKNDMEVRR